MFSPKDNFRKFCRALQTGRSFRSKDFLSQVISALHDQNTTKLRKVLLKAARPVKNVRNLTSALSECVTLDSDTCLRVLLDCCQDLHPETDFLTPCFDDAIERRSSRCLDVFMERGCDVNARDVEGRTALHRAAIASDFEAFRMLLERGACAKTLDSNRQSPLQVNREVELRLRQIVNNFRASYSPEVSEVEEDEDENRNDTSSVNMAASSSRQERRSASWKQHFERQLRHFNDELRHHKLRTEDMFQQLTDKIQNLSHLFCTTLAAQTHRRTDMEDG